MAVEQQTIPATQLAQWMASVGAQWAGRNEAGGNVYNAADAIYVAVASPDGRTVTIRRMPRSCAC